MVAVASTSKPRLENSNVRVAQKKSGGMHDIVRLPFTNRRERTPLSATGAWVRAAAGDLFMHPLQADCER